MEGNEARRLAARLGGLTTAGRHDPQSMTASARRAFMARFEAEADPEGTLTEAERTRRARALLSAYMTRKALEREQAKRRRRQAAEDAATAALIDEAMALEIGAGAAR